MEPRELGLLHLGIVLGRRILHNLRRPRSDDQDVTVPKLYALVIRYRLNILDRNAISVKRMERFPLGVHVAFEIDQHASPNEPAAGVPVVNRGQLILGGCLRRCDTLLGDLQAIVCQARRHVLKVYEAIPLAAALRVELEGIIPYEFVLGEWEGLVSGRWASWNGDLAAVERPAGHFPSVTG